MRRISAFKRQGETFYLFVSIVWPDRALTECVQTMVCRLFDYRGNQHFVNFVITAVFSFFAM